LALLGVGPEREAESVRFHWRRMTKVGPEVKHGPELGPLNKGCERRTRALPDVSGGGERPAASTKAAMMDALRAFEPAHANTCILLEGDVHHR
jgi:hypothetical protein